MIDAKTLRISHQMMILSAQRPYAAPAAWMALVDQLRAGGDDLPVRVEMLACFGEEMAEASRAQLVGQDPVPHWVLAASYIDMSIDPPAPPGDTPATPGEVE